MALSSGQMQQTLASAATVRGIGLHSGAPVTMTMEPAAAGAGIVFVRTDIAGMENRIPARWNAVADTRLCTAIANEAGVSVGTIEHLMAALRGCGIDNAVISLNGPEVPVMDGSAAPFVAAIDEAGIVRQDAPRRAIRILKEVRITLDGKTARLLPADTCSFDACIDFSHPAIGRQDFSVTLVNGTFRHDIADARTFGFLREVEALRRSGLALGGSTANAIVLDDTAVLNDGGLRFHNEFIRHKLLDAIGDLYLAGAPIIGAYEADRPGHALNNALLHALFAAADSYEIVEMAADYTAAAPAFLPRDAAAAAA